MYMFIVVFIIAKCKSQKQPKCPLPNEWINKTWYIHKMEYYLVIKKNEELINSVTWMNLKNIMLNEKSQSPRTKYYMTPFI